MQYLWIAVAVSKHRLAVSNETTPATKQEIS